MVGLPSRVNTTAGRGLIIHDLFCPFGSIPACLRMPILLFRTQLRVPQACGRTTEREHGHPSLHTLRNSALRRIRKAVQLLREFHLNAETNSRQNFLACPTTATVLSIHTKQATRHESKALELRVSQYAEMRDHSACSAGLQQTSLARSEVSPRFASICPRGFYYLPNCPSYVVDQRHAIPWQNVQGYPPATRRRASTKRLRLQISIRKSLLGV